MESERRVIFAEPVDINEEDENEDLPESQMGDLEGAEDLEDEDIPVKKVRKFDEEEMLTAKQELMLTRNFKLKKEFAAAYTGGPFVVLKDGRYGLGLKDEVVCLIQIDSGKVLGKIVEENEAVISFTVSPNQQILVTTTKNYLVKAYRLPALQDPEQQAAVAW